MLSARGGLFAVWLSAVAAAQVPSGVVYKTASAEANKRAEERLKAAFAKEPAHLIAADQKGLVSTGPFLGQQLKPDELAKLTKTHYVMPLGDLKAQVEGASAQDKPQWALLDSVLARLAPKAPVTVRKLRPDEMALIWFFIAWDITEPIFVVENANHHWVVDFDEDGKNVTWVEDITAPCFTPSVDPNRNCFCMVVEGQGAQAHVMFDRREHAKGCSDQEKATEPGSELVSLELIKLLTREEDLDARVEVKAFTDYMKKLVATAGAFAKTVKGKTQPTAVTISIAIRKDGAHRAWVDAEKGIPLPESSRLAAELAKVSPPPAAGWVAFQLQVQFFPAGAKKSSEVYPGSPAEWATAAKPGEKELLLETALERIFAGQK